MREQICDNNKLGVILRLLGRNAHEVRKTKAYLGGIYT